MIVKDPLPMYFVLSYYVLVMLIIFYDFFFRCSCPPGHFRSGTTRCTKHVDCFSSNICLNGGTCIKSPFSSEASCACPPSFEGSICDKKIHDLPFTLSGDRNFIIIIILALMSLLSKFILFYVMLFFSAVKITLSFLGRRSGRCLKKKSIFVAHSPENLSVLVLMFVVYNRRREAQIKYPNPDDDVRENIINYEDEGGGEDDMTAFDITPLQIPVADPAAIAASGAHHSLPRSKLASSCKRQLF